jgi:hypothetical protein
VVDLSGVAGLLGKGKAREGLSNMSSRCIELVNDRGHHPPVEEPVKPEIARGVRRLVPRRRRARRRPGYSTDGPVTIAAGWPPGAIEDPHLDFESAAQGAAGTAADGDPRSQANRPSHRRAGGSADRGEGFDPAEFAEFLEADDSPIPATQVFKERLRQQIWGLVRGNTDAIAPPKPSPTGNWSQWPGPGPNPKLPR